MSDSAKPYRNPVKERLRAGQPALGLGVRMCRSADIARIARGSGHDFLFIDTQHAVFDIETITHIAQAADALGIAPIVRVRSLGDPDVPLLLDNGVTGIVFPDISTADQARRAVEIVRFPPVGRRSVAGGYAQFDYRAVPVAEATRRLDEGTLLAVMIETPEGLENVEAIAAVPGIDVLHVGTNDLLVGMGKAGQFDHPDALAAQDRVIAAAKARGIAAGCGGNRDVARQAAAVRRGALFLTTQTDVALLNAAATAWAGGVRAALARNDWGARACIRAAASARTVSPCTPQCTNSEVLAEMKPPHAASARPVPEVNRSKPWTRKA